MTLTEKVAYLKGILEGMNYDTTKAEGKLIGAMVDLLSEITESVSELEETCDTLHSYAEELDEDLGAVEDMLYDEDEGCGDDCCCHGEDDEISDDDFIEVDCPKCGETVCFDDTIDPTSILCPNCGEEFSCICDCCDEDDADEQAHV